MPLFDGAVNENIWRIMRGVVVHGAALVPALINSITAALHAPLCTVIS